MLFAATQPGVFSMLIQARWTVLYFRLLCRSIGSGCSILVVVSMALFAGLKETADDLLVPSNPHVVPAHLQNIHV